MCWLLYFVLSCCRNTCLSVLPASDVCPSFLLALNTLGKHIWECQTTEGDQSMYVCERVRMHVSMTEMSLSVLGVSPREREMLTKLCGDKWFISKTLNLKACHISSFCLQTCIQTLTGPSAETLTTPCSFTHFVFCGNTIILVYFRSCRVYCKL